MRIVAVNAAVAHKTHEVKGGAVLFAVFHCADKGFILKKVAVLNGLCNSCQLLINNAACADVCVTDLAVAHLTVRKTDVHSGSADIGYRVFAHEAVKVRLVSRGNGVAFG